MPCATPEGGRGLGFGVLHFSFPQRFRGLYNMGVFGSLASGTCSQQKQVLGGLGDKSGEKLMWDSALGLNSKSSLRAAA